MQISGLIWEAKQMKNQTCHGLIIQILARGIIYHYISPVLRSKVKSKHHLHSAWSQYWPFSQKPASPTTQSHNLWRGGGVFTDKFYHCQKQACWTIPHPPGWPGPTESCRRCRSSPVWNQWKWLWCSRLRYSFSRSWQSRCWAPEWRGSCRRRLLELGRLWGLRWCPHWSVEEDCGWSTAQGSALHGREEWWLSWLSAVSARPDRCRQTDSARTGWHSEEQGHHGLAFFSIMKFSLFSPSGPASSRYGGWEMKTNFQTTAWRGENAKTRPLGTW